MSEETTGTTVRYRYDPNDPGTLTADQEARLDAISDGEIDLSDIPSREGKAGWRPGALGSGVIEVRRAAMRQGLLMLDEDVVDALRNCQDDSPGKLNAVLREYAETHRRTA